MVHVCVKLFATLSRHFAGVMPGTPLGVEVLDGATLIDLVDQLKVPHAEVRIIFVNGRIQPLDYKLQPGDEVGMFPPVGGG